MFDLLGHGEVDLTAAVGWALSNSPTLMSGLLEALQLEVADDHLTYRQEDRQGWIERQDLSAVFREGRHLVMLDHDTRLRARLDADALDAGDLLGGGGVEGAGPVLLTSGPPSRRRGWSSARWRRCSGWG